MANRRDVASPVLVRLGSEPAAVIRLDRPLTIVGTKLHSHLRIVSPAISGSHALLLNLGNHVFLRDLMSRTGAFLNDRAVVEAPLNYGDVLRFGDMRFRFVDTDVVRPSLSRTQSSPAELRISGRPEPIVIDKPLFVVGRQAGADLILESRRVSKAHAVLYMQAGGWMLRDLGSREGTLVNGAPIRRLALTGGEVVRIGRTSFTFNAASPAEGGKPSEEAAPWELCEDGVHDDGEGGGEHVFVDEPVVISDGPAPTHEWIEAERSIGEFLPMPAESPVENLTLIDAPALEGLEAVESTPPIWERNPASTTFESEEPGAITGPAGPAEQRATDAHDLVDWGLVVENPPAPADPLPEDREEEPVTDGSSHPLTDVAPHACDGMAAEQRGLPALAVAGPATLSAPVDLERLAAPAAMVPASINEMAPPSHSKLPGQPPEPLEEILDDHVLALFGAGTQSPPRPGRSSAPQGRRRLFRKIRSVVLGAALLALAVVAGGVWLYVHRS